MRFSSSVKNRRCEEACGQPLLHVAVELRAHRIAGVAGIQEGRIGDQPAEQVVDRLIARTASARALPASDAAGHVRKPALIVLLEGGAVGLCLRKVAGDLRCIVARIEIGQIPLRQRPESRAGGAAAAGTLGRGLCARFRSGLRGRLGAGLGLGGLGLWRSGFWRLVWARRGGLCRRGWRGGLECLPPVHLSAGKRCSQCDHWSHLQRVVPPHSTFPAASKDLTPSRGRCKHPRASRPGPSGSSIGLRCRTGTTNGAARVSRLSGCGGTAILNCPAVRRPSGPPGRSIT